MRSLEFYSSVFYLNLSFIYHREGMEDRFIFFFFLLVI